VIALDGDGSLIMRMGAMAAIGAAQPPNLIHIVLDNGVHESTGCQPTLSSGLDLVGLAKACGYRRVVRACGPSDVASVLDGSLDVLTFVAAATQPRFDRNLPRPGVAPKEVTERFRNWLRT
jgi:phosphonopyruvate decarboxylase